MTGGFPSQRQVIQNFDGLFDISQNELLNKQWSWQPFETAWHTCYCSNHHVFLPQSSCDYRILYKYICLSFDHKWKSTNLQFLIFFSFGYQFVLSNPILLHFSVVFTFICWPVTNFLKNHLQLTLSKMVNHEKTPTILALKYIPLAFPYCLLINFVSGWCLDDVPREDWLTFKIGTV